jgi:hypothetical protein
MDRTAAHFCVSCYPSCWWRSFVSFEITYSTIYQTVNEPKRSIDAFDRDDLKDFDLESLPEQFQSIIAKTIQTTIPKEQDHSKNAHDPFRFEWGTWINKDSIQELMVSVDSIRASTGSFDLLLSEQQQQDATPTSSVKVNLLKGQQWELNLYALTSNSQC